jgi:very-short-patch-repair endonuclease
MLWDYLRCSPLGYKFRRQHPVGNYIVDFYCHKLKLVIEVDGPMHDNEYNEELDKERQMLLESKGISVIRFSNDEIINNRKCSIEKINSILNGHRTYSLPSRDQGT